MSNVVSNGIALLALIVSGVSLYVSWLNYSRAAEAERVTGWIEIKRTYTPGWFLGLIRLTNPSRSPISVEKLTIDLPDFRLGDFSSAYEDDGAGNRTLRADLDSLPQFLAMPIKRRVEPGESVDLQFLVFQPIHSRRTGSKVTVGYIVMAPTPRSRTLPFSITTRASF